MNYVFGFEGIQMFFIFDEIEQKQYYKNIAV
jgi:hypothetical protein